MLDDATLETIVVQYFDRTHLVVRSKLDCPNLPGLYFDVAPAMTDGIIGVFIRRDSGEILAFGFRAVNEARRLIEHGSKPYDPCAVVQQMLSVSVQE
jgi:hypothetical protein